MANDRFPHEVAEELKWYVYRLIDPRNGETFYVGKGKWNRVFEHAKGIIGNPDDYTADPKSQRINEIRAAGLDVAHVIHRHGMTSERTAYEVEAALIDAYPGLLNKVAGHGTKDFGSRHVAEIIAEYVSEPFEIGEPLILISIGNLWRIRGIYDAVRGVWKIDQKKAEKHHLVLGHVRGVVKGAYRPEKWLSATKENFPFEAEDLPGRFGFIGEEAEPKVWDKYVGKLVPEQFRRRGAANPIRYCRPSTS